MLVQMRISGGVIHATSEVLVPWMVGLYPSMYRQLSILLKYM